MSDADTTTSPSERLLNEAEVLRRLTISRSTLYRWVRSGAFPAPLQLGPRRVAWSGADFDDWIQSRKLRARKDRIRQRLDDEAA